MEIKLTETAFRAFLRQYDGMMWEHAAKSELSIFRKFFELQNWYFWQSLLYVGILEVPPQSLSGELQEGGGGVVELTRHTSPPNISGILASTLEIELEPQWWEASAQSQLLHLCSLLLSNCKIISTLIIT